MIVIPDKYSSKELKTSRKYIDPLCGIQHSEESDVEWVQCPLIDNQFIGLGCCIDYQTTALEDDFDHAYFRELYDTASRQTNQSVVFLRCVCLEHQHEILVQRLQDHTYKQYHVKFQAHLERVEELLEQKC